MTSIVAVRARVGLESDADSSPESDTLVGVPSRYIDDATTVLNILASHFEMLLKSRIRAFNRLASGYPHPLTPEATAEINAHWMVAGIEALEKQASRELGKALRNHPLWPWLKPLKGVAGPRTARLIALIGDPRRFPGQPCTEGHYLPPSFPVGSPCPITKSPHADSALESETRDGVGEPFDGTDALVESDRRNGSVDSSPDSDDFSAESDALRARCPGIMLPPRTTTGTRSLWHYLGLHAVDGKAPRFVAGRQADWNAKGKTLILGPEGIADQIVRHRTSKYREIYDEVKARKLGLVDRPIDAERIARKVAAKAFVADLLAEWKRIIEAEGASESDGAFGFDAEGG